MGNFVHLDLYKREINRKVLNEHIGAQIETQSCKSDINGRNCFNFDKFLGNVQKLCFLQGKNILYPGSKKKHW